MEKIKEFFAWVGKDGLLCALINYSIMLTVFPIFTKPVEGVIASFLVTLVVALGKEIYDIFRNDEAQKAWHDLLCDALGMVCAVLTWVLWWLCGL